MLIKGPTAWNYVLYGATSWGGGSRQLTTHLWTCCAGNAKCHQGHLGGAARDREVGGMRTVLEGNTAGSWPVSSALTFKRLRGKT